MKVTTGRHEEFGGTPSWAVLLAAVLRWIHEHGRMPLTRNQAPEEGRQFFRMRNELRQVLDAELSQRRCEPSHLDDLSESPATKMGVY